MLPVKIGNKYYTTKVVDNCVCDNCDCSSHCLDRKYSKFLQELCRHIKDNEVFAEISLNQLNLMI